jgi:hypothetical protein
MTYPQRLTPPPTQNRFRQVTPDVNNSVGAMNFEIHSPDEFIKYAKLYHDKNGKPAPHVPFMSYWPTYRSFTKEQLQWYLYWRGEVRHGRYPATDLSYIFVHVYELLCLVEAQDPLVVIKRMMALIKAYGKTYPNLKGYLYDWAGDLLIDKKGVPLAIDWWTNKWFNEHVPPPQCIMNLILRHFEELGRIDDLPYSIWQELNSYRPQNKFYREYNQDSTIDQAYLKAIHVVNMYLLSLKTGKGVLQSFTQDRINMQTKYLYSSAIVPSNWHQIKELGPAKNYVTIDGLGNFLLKITKYTENILRKQQNFSAKLSGFNLDERYQKVLDKAFEIQPEPVKIILDANKIQSLHTESERVESLLRTETAPITKPLYTDIAQVRAMWNLLDIPSKYVLLAIYSGEITRPDGKDGGVAQPELIKNLNERSLRFLGDQIISIGDADGLFIADDFKDEMELITRDNVLDDLRPKGGIEADIVTALPWQAFFNALSAEERQFMQQFAAKGSMSESEITSFARERNQMGNLLVDSVSSKAIQYTSNNPFYTEGDRLMFDEEALIQLRLIFVIDGA